MDNAHKTLRASYNVTHSSELAPSEFSLLHTIYDGCGLVATVQVLRLMFPRMNLKSSHDIIVHFRDNEWFCK